MTKTDTLAQRIRDLHAGEPHLKAPAIAESLQCSPNYVRTQLWRIRNPGYGAQYMRDLRAADPGYRAHERAQQTRRRHASSRRKPDEVATA